MGEAIGQGERRELRGGALAIDSNREEGRGDENNAMFWRFGCELCNGRCGVNTTDNQQGNVYPSFIVRLSFVISSFKVGDR
ncbi:hypothetical protein C4H12_12840 [Capnocytophaga sp. oral taxon 878]|nr:hypothetical protein C4H12_12840 [Capnocytophaga sp. oral taxon 878]